MVLQRIKDIFATPQEATSLDGARPGKAILVGTVEAGDEALSSPLRRIHCVAFYYKSIWMPPAKSNDAPSEHTKAAVYAAGFLLRMADGAVQVLPPAGDEFGAGDHQQLLAQGLPGYMASEQLVRPGDRVRLHGKLSLEGELPALELKRMDILEQTSSEEAAGNRRQRRAQRRKNKRKR